MTDKKRIFIGIIGALSPLLINLVVIDYDTLFPIVSYGRLIGYAIKAIIFSGIGILFTVVLHKTETDALKLYQIAISAPALILSLNSASNANDKKPTLPTSSLMESVSSHSFSLMDFLPGASAQTNKSNVDSSFYIFQYKFPEQQTSDEIWQGVSGQGPENIYFVLDSKFREPKDAFMRAFMINKSQNKYRAKVYLPFRFDIYFSVVLESNLTYKEAVNLKYNLSNSNISSEPFIWTFPDTKQNKELYRQYEIKGRPNEMIKN